MGTSRRSCKAIGCIECKATAEQRSQWCDAKRDLSRKLCWCSRYVEMTPYSLSNISSAALIYNVVNSTIDSVRGQHDVWGGMAAGGVCGLLYKSTGT